MQYSPQDAAAYYGGYYPVAPPTQESVMVAKEEKATGFVAKVADLFESETREPTHIKFLAFFSLGTLGSLFMPFYPWWMVLLIGTLVGLIAYRLPNLSLFLLVVFVTGEVAYQGPELGMVFLVFSLIILGASLFDWKFGVLVFFMLFFGRFGIPYIIPIMTTMIYSTFLGIAVGVVGGLFITFFITVGNYQVLGFLIGPLTPGTHTLANGLAHGADGKTALAPVQDNFNFNTLFEAVRGMGGLDNRVMEAGFANIGASVLPYLEILGWSLAFFIVSLIVKERSKITMEKWMVFTGISAAIILLCALGAMLFSPASLFNVQTIMLMLGILGVVYTGTALGLIIQDVFAGYFTSRMGMSTIGTRIAEMTSLAKTTFEMVGGLKDVKADIKESMIVPLMRHDIAEQFGIEPPKGIMLFGPPGCGKTLLMKALATELNVEMISVKCSDVMSKWYGESEGKVAELFKTAKERKPCILFMDEIDAIAKRRDLYSADDVSPRLLSIILSELDGMDKAAGIIVVGTTNKPEMVDPALMRPGRFDKIIYVPPPDYEERIDVFKVHLVGKPTAPDINLAELAKKTERMSGADIANLVKEASTIAMKRSMQMGQMTLVTHSDFLEVLPHVKPSISLRMKEDYERLKMDYERKMHELVRAERKIVVRWDDVGGLEDVKRALREYVELPLTKPELLEEYKLKSGRGILLFGPPGCGKTHVMRAASNELNVPIQIVNGPELVSALAGASEAAIRDVLSRARENAPSIVFFDEIDALASKESMKTPEVSRAVSQFLTEMDGLRPKDKVIIVATTNRPHLLDPAILRPGRFDKIFYVPPPDLQARKDIFEIHLRDVPKAGYIDSMLLAHRTEGYSGADIAAIIDEAKLIAIRQRVADEGGMGARPGGTQQLAQYLQAPTPVGAPVADHRYGVKMEHILEALTKTKSSITPETLEWARKFMEIYGTR
jgi:SpoVK/Ycf46/Vps4 family AAA+-type ATPase